MVVPGQIAPVNIEQRDLHILRSLSAGPATRKYLLRYYGKKADGTFMSRQRLGQILQRLEDDSFIVSTIYPLLNKRRKLSVFTLTKQGGQEVTRAFGIDPDFIRTHVPAPMFIRHEMVVAECMRMLWREEEEHLYKVKYVYDQNAIYHMMKDKRRGVPIPDLRLCIQPQQRPLLTVNLEIDFDTVGLRQWIKRTKAWTNDITLVMTVTEARAQYLSNIAKHTKAMWGFASYATWSKDGFSRTKWWWPGARRHAALPIH